MDRIFHQFYEEFIDGTDHWFLCKYHGCGELENRESEIKEHLRQHFEQEGIPENQIQVNLSNESAEHRPSIECIDLTIDEDESEPIDQNNGRNWLEVLPQEAQNIWNEWFDIETNGKMKCKLSTDCHFECELYTEAEQHLTEHYECRPSGCNHFSILTPRESRDQFQSGHMPSQSTRRENVTQTSQTRHVVERGRGGDRGRCRGGGQGRPKSTNLTSTSTTSSSEPPLVGTNTSGISIVDDQQASTSRRSAWSIDSNEAQDLRITSRNTSQSLAQSSDVIGRYRDFIEVKSIDSDPHYFCKSCRFYSNSATEIEEHVRQKHLGFRCEVEDCDRMFKTQNSFDSHRRNHICGFGIRGKKASGVCSVNNVRKYRRRVFVVKYKCEFCGLESDSETTALFHIHNRHIHPQP